MMIGVRSVVVGGVLGVLALTGCAADPNDGSDEVSVDGVAADDAADDLHPAETVSLNCGTSLPGFPPLPCNPDLRFKQTMVQVVEPGSNVAPGNYVWFQFTNDSKKAAGPFTARITDGNGVILKTASYPGLGAGASSTIIVYAPLGCGWSRSAELDVGNAVLEADEGNNTTSYAIACQRR